MAADKKTKSLFRLMEIFLSQKEITPYDEHILNEFECSSKTLERYLKDLEELYGHIIQVKKDKKNVWKLIKVSDIFEEFISNSDDLFYLFEMAREFDPVAFKELEKSTLKKLATKESTFIFKNYIMEEMESKEAKSIFKDLKQAVKNREYRDIHYLYDKEYVYEDVKPLKLVFMDNNWYIAIVTKDKEFKFLRLSFITKVSKLSSHSRFQSVDTDKYMQGLAKAQNSMTIIDKNPTTAIIKATPSIAKYFKKDMKKFMPSQEFRRELDDGSVIFSLKYTQELEILPLIQKWLPDLIIQEPQELKDALAKKLKQALDSYNGN